MQESPDNCPEIKNPNQTDQDNDLVGDVCDNCPSKFNPFQQVTITIDSSLIVFQLKS